MITILVLALSVFSVSASLDHRHRHSRSHPSDYNFYRLMNRLDSHTTPTPAVVTEEEPGNSLWDEFTEESSSVSPLDADRWEKIITDKERQIEDREDAEDELEEKSDEEDGFEDQKEQADSYKPWNLKSAESSHTDWKVDNLGNRNKLDRMFEVYRYSKQDKDTANNEFVKHSWAMSTETVCRVPRPKVIKVSDVYPSTNKLYTPACTVLHQCAEDTGCCPGAGKKCGPKRTNRVELYFHTTYVVQSHKRQLKSNGLEKLPFYNHTECECQSQLEEVMPRDGQTGEYRTETNPDIACKCPSEYTVRRLSNGSCTCDCFDKQQDCLKYKKGKKYFNYSDRVCIEMGTCKLPACDFGNYLRTAGRCPMKNERLRTWSRYH